MRYHAETAGSAVQAKAKPSPPARKILCGAYAASIRRLAALAPEIKLVFGAHNVPVAQPAVLAQLVAAFDMVRAGKVTLTPDSPGKVLYKVGDISFLMRAPKP
ncbi:MAG TPA: hypothetical protein VMD99_15930 [Terriglobales bacterium]|nr:hypothetical protein [Terriglobales bacterium]